MICEVIEPCKIRRVSGWNWLTSYSGHRTEAAQLFSAISEALIMAQHKSYR